MQAKTLADKIWQAHLIETPAAEPDLLYIDLHLLHEVTSPQAFAGLRYKERPVRRPELTVATIDHTVPTEGRDKPWADPQAVKQAGALKQNCADFGITFFDVDDPRQGIVHVVGPEQGLTLPGMTIVCGDSHTATHGAFGALAFGIGTSEVEHVLGTQTLPQKQSKNLAVQIDGRLPSGVSAKDVILAVIAELGVSGGAGYVIEYRGSLMPRLSMEERMTICNMTIEAGARAGLIAPDETTYAYLENRPFAPTGDAWQQAIDFWQTLRTDEGASFDKTIRLDAGAIAPRVTWGITPAQSVPVNGRIPDPDQAEEASARDLARRALAYMGLEPNTRITDIGVDRVFIGSCTNGRIEDLRAAATVAKGRQVAAGVKAMVVPGSGLTKMQAEKEGLDQIFVDAGFEWREPGCSMCLAMNPDVLSPKERCASTSNRNFEGRQGKDGRTHLVSPQTAAATAIAGHFVDVRELQQ